MSWTEIITLEPLLQNTFTLRRPRVAIFDDVKIVTMFKKTIFKDTPQKLKELEIMYQIAIYISIS